MNENSSIPKIIHYCWFGKGNIPEKEKQCMKSWEKILPDYKIMLWNEDSFDVTALEWTNDAYINKKYAFVSDYVRLYALYMHGGIYLDTDVKVIKSFNPLLQKNGFMCFEDGTSIASAVIGAAPRHPLIEKFKMVYENGSYMYGDSQEANTQMMTRILKSHGLIANNKRQEICGMSIYPRTYFNPMDYFGNWEQTRNTYCIHYFSGSWLSDEEKEKLHRSRRLSRQAYKRIRGLARVFLNSIKERF